MKANEICDSLRTSKFHRFTFGILVPQEGAARLLVLVLLSPAPPRNFNVVDSGL